jgi:hypothetical protein
LCDDWMPLDGLDRQNKRHKTQIQQDTKTERAKGASCPRDNSRDARSRFPVNLYLKKEACHKRHETAGAIAEASRSRRRGPISLAILLFFFFFFFFTLFSFRLFHVLLLLWYLTFPVPGVTPVDAARYQS